MACMTITRKLSTEDMYYDILKGIIRLGEVTD